MQARYITNWFLKGFFSLFFLAFAILAHAQTPLWHWAKTSTGGYDYNAENIGHDALGNVYVLNEHDSNARFGNFSVNNTGHAVILSKHNTNGYLEFAKELRGLSGFISMATDHDGNAIVLGGFDEHITIDTTNLYGSASDGNLFVAKYDNHGDFLWVKTLSVRNSFRIYKGLCIDANGNIYLNITSRNGFTILGSDTLQSSGSHKPYLLTVKFDAVGNVKWLKPLFATSMNVETYSIAADKNENVYIAGYHVDSLFADSLGQHIPNSNSASSFIAKRDKNGNLQWAKDILCNPDLSMATNDKNDLFIYGVFEDSFSFNQTRIQNGKGYFLLKCDSAGNNAWCKTVRDKDYVDFRQGLATDKAGNVYTLGTRSDSLTVGNIFFNTRGSHDYLIKYDPSGSIVWGYSLNRSSVSELCVDNNGSLLITGRVSSKDSFSNIVINPITDGNTFIGKFSDQIPNGISAVNAKEDIHVYPNPSAGTFTLDLNGYKYNSLIITDQLGRTIYKQSLVGEQIVQLHLDNIATDIYYLKAIGSHASQTIKLQLNR